jgi:hypothetical protein
MADFKDMTPGSRIWIYQSRTELSPDLVSRILERAKVFLDDWSSHGSKMMASCEVLHGRFVVIAVDERTAPASGCGIDKSIHFIQSLEKEFGLTLLDRLAAAWEENGHVKTAGFGEFQALVDAGKIDKNTIVFNNLVETKAQMESSWRLPLMDSWHRRFVKS